MASFRQLCHRRSHYYSSYHRITSLKCICLIIFGCSLFIAYVIIWHIAFGASILHQHIAYKLVHNTFDKDLDIYLDSYIENKHLYDNITFLIGIGCVKCGTTTVRELIALVTSQINRYKYNYNYNYYWGIFNKREPHYFDSCTNYMKPKLQTNKRCPIEEYIKYLKVERSFWKMSRLNRSKLILMEKTPTYHIYSSTAYYLTLYGHIYNIKLYLLLRNPVKRFWSNLWMQQNGRCTPRNKPIECTFWDEMYRLNSSIIQHEYILSNRYMNIMKFYDKKYPESYKLLQALKIKENERNNDNIDEDEIVKLYINSLYEHWILQKSIYDNPILSCYYPIILMWNKYWKYWNQHKKFKDTELYPLSNNFKIVQSELLFDSSSSSQIVESLLCWASDQTDSNKCKRHHPMMDEIVSDLRLKTENNSNAYKFNHFSADKVDIMDLEIGQYLMKEFYVDCNNRLYWFLSRNPDILLSTHKFERW